MWWTSVYEVVYQFLKNHIEITLLGAVTLVQISPIKINPWSWLAKVIHDLLFADIDKKLDTIFNKVEMLERKGEERDAIQARADILRFADELYNGIDHSKEYFDDILTSDIDRYENYCEAHPDFPNSKTVMSVQHIKDTYARLMKDHKFL